MRQTLKEARKECRQYIKENWLWRWPICFNAKKGFYIEKYEKPRELYYEVFHNKEVVFTCFVDGTLEKSVKTKEAIRFHEELLKIRKKRNKENK